MKTLFTRFATDEFGSYRDRVRPHRRPHRRRRYRCDDHPRHQVDQHVHGGVEPAEVRRLRTGARPDRAGRASLCAFSECDYGKCRRKSLPCLAGPPRRGANQVASGNRGGAGPTPS